VTNRETATTEDTEGTETARDAFGVFGDLGGDLFAAAPDVPDG